MSKVRLFSSLVAAFALTTTTVSMADDVIGKVIAQGKVLVQSSVNNTKASIEDTTYSYFDSDKLITDANSKAVVELASGDGYILIEQGSSASLDKDANVYTVNVDRGSLVFSFKAGTDFKLIANDKVVRPSLDEGYELVSSSDAKWVSGKITVNQATDNVEFQAIAGDYTFSDVSSNEVQQIVAGETLLAQNNQQPVILKTQAGTTTEDDDDLTPLWVFLASVGIIGAADGSSSSSATPATPPVSNPAS